MVDSHSQSLVACEILSCSTLLCINHSILPCSPFGVVLVGICNRRRTTRRYDDSSIWAESWLMKTDFKKTLTYENHRQGSIPYCDFEFSSSNPEANIQRHYFMYIADDC